MRPSPTYHPPKEEECETSVEHGLPHSAEPAERYCSRRPRPSLMWGSRYVVARAVGPWVSEQKPLSKTPLGGNPSPEMTYLPPYLPMIRCRAARAIWPKYVKVSKRFVAQQCHACHLEHTLQRGTWTSLRSPTTLEARTSGDRDMPTAR